MTRRSWNAGFTKATHPSVRKIAITMRRRKIDNFREWRNRMRLLGVIPNGYPRLHRSGDLAEYIGVVLGDGHIEKFPRTERVLISANSNNPGFIERYARMTKKIFDKEPTVQKVSNKNNVRISLYQKEISKRLGIPCGHRGNITVRIPKWVWARESYIKRLLRGLFEAEGSLSIHRPTYTYNLGFSNRNQSLLNIVRNGLILLGYHPEVRSVAVRLRRKQEVEKFLNSVRFRKY